jgi:hypothetical protein
MAALETVRNFAWGHHAVGDDWDYPYSGPFSVILIDRKKTPRCYPFRKILIPENEFARARRIRMGTVYTTSRISASAIVKAVDVADIRYSPAELRHWMGNHRP